MAKKNSAASKIKKKAKAKMAVPGRFYILHSSLVRCLQPLGALYEIYRRLLRAIPFDPA